MAAIKKTHGGVWENRETMLLLQKWGMKIYKQNYCPVQERSLYGKKSVHFYGQQATRIGTKTPVKQEYILW